MPTDDARPTIDAGRRVKSEEAKIRGRS